MEVKNISHANPSKIYPMYYAGSPLYLKIAENDLFMIDIIMNMKYISQIPVEKIYAICRKNCIKKMLLGKYNKNLRQFLTCDLQFTNDDCDN